MQSKKFASPAGTAVYPWLNDPDFKFDSAGVYKVDLRLDPSDPKVQAFEDAINAYADECYADLVERLEADYEAMKAERLKSGKKEPKPFEPPARASMPIREETDEDDEPTGMLIFRSKMKATVTPKGKDSFTQRPKVFDASGMACKVAPKIGGGSTLRVSAEAIPFFQKETGAGITMRLKGVQVIDLVLGEGGASAADHGFSTEDGYTVDQTEGEFEGNGGDY